MDLIRAMKSDWRKTKRTAFRYIVLLVPILFSLLIVSYASIYKKDYTFQIKVYNLYFETIGVALPMVVAILTGLNIMIEEGAGDFRRMLTVPISRSTIYFSKLFMIILVTIIDMLVSVGILLAGMKFNYTGANIQYGVFLQGTALAIIGSLFLYGLYLIISINFGLGPTIAVGVGGSVWGALLQTGLGDHTWQFVPWAWSGRLAIIPSYLLKDFATFAKMQSMQNVDELLNTMFTKYIYTGLPVALISFVTICFAGMIWFEKWEGRKVHQ